MRGIDVRRVEASTVNEDKQDIEDAAIQTSVENVESSMMKVQSIAYPAPRESAKSTEYRATYRVYSGY